MGSHPIGLEAAAETNPAASLSTQTVTVYTRHQESCPKNGEPYWKRCHCMKYLYVYRENTSRQVSAKTRSWEKAEERAQEIRDSWSPVKALQRELEERVRKSEAREVLISDAVALFLKEVERLNREVATRAKYRLTLEDRLLNWCTQQKPPVARLSELDVETMRRWIHSWPGAPTTRHNQHQRVITFFFFCMEQGWIKENPARKIKKVAPEQDETQPFTREQYDALIQATWLYDSREGKKIGDTVNARRARTHLKLLRWSGLRAGDAACLSRDKLRDDDSLFLYQKKVKAKQVLLSMVYCHTMWPRNCGRCRAAPTHIRAISFGVGAANVRAKFRIGSKSLGRFWLRPPRHIPSCFWRLMAALGQRIFTCSETLLRSSISLRACHWRRFRVYWVTPVY